MKKRRTSLSGFRLIDDRTAVFGFLAFLVIVLFLFDAVADQQALSGSGTDRSGESDELTKEFADKIMSKLTINSREENGIGFIVKDTIDPELLEHFTKLDYETVKARLGIRNEFMIYLEDEQGMIIPIGDKLCIGSSEAKINGIPCG